MSTSDFLALRSFLGESDFLELEKFVKEVYKIKLELQCLFEEKNVITREYEIQKSMFYAAKDLFSNLDKDADVYDLDELRKRA